MKHLLEFEDLSKSNNYVIKDEHRDSYTIDVEQACSDIFKALPYYKGRLKKYNGRDLTDLEIKYLIRMYVETEADMMSETTSDLYPDPFGQSEQLLDEWGSKDIDDLADLFIFWLYGDGSEDAHGIDIDEYLEDFDPDEVRSW